MDKQENQLKDIKLYQKQVLLTRLLQFKILKNNYCSEDLFEFVHDFRVAKISDRKYINLSRGTTFLRDDKSISIKKQA